MWNDILGQPKAVAYLQKLAGQNRAPGALLFYGQDGVGKRKAALEFAKALNCEDFFSRQTGDSCGACPSCQAIEKGTHPDVTLVDFVYQARLLLKQDADEDALEKEIEKQQHLSVDTIRQVTAKSQQKAVGPGWKVFIIDHAQTMQAAAANALLKFIEEPPAKTVWILLTTKRAAMLPTILSRCQPIGFAPLSPAQVTQILQATQADVADPARCAQFSGGSITGALQAAQALELLEEGQWNTPQGPTQVAGGLSRTAALARKEAQAVLDVLIQALHTQWAQADESQRTSLQTALVKFEDYKKSIGRNVSPALVLETALMSLDGLNVEV
ncbi:MAG: DNA polymerase III subunit delta' [Elusimicrobiaceae bacterium]|nr:DNA polymerase III subunit delta' [Elusimicrobiaceae bacterium]